MLEIDWTVLLFSGVVLFPPATLFYPSAAKECLVHSRSARFRLEYLFLTWQHWFDFARAFLGTYFLVEYGAIFVAIDSGASYWYQDWLLVAGMLGVAVSFQTIQFRTYFYFTAPIFFIWGLTFALYGWLPVLFATLFSAIVARLVDHVEIKLPLMAGLLAVSGYLLLGGSVELILCVVLVLLPSLLALSSMKHLVCFSLGMPIRRSV
jgi:hypothetical protein